jgi:hypothetical protein
LQPAVPGSFRHNKGKETTMQARIARIANAIVRRHVDPGRQPRWVQDIDRRHDARIQEAVGGTRVR